MMRQGAMKFKGYYYIPEEHLPVERLLFHNDHVYWVRIDSKKQYDMDVSGGFYDEDVGANICLTPTYIVDLTFRVLMKDPPKAKMDQILLEINEDETLLKERRD